MTTAREQAREALRDRFEHTQPGDFAPGEFDFYLADAASDVWEAKVVRLQRLVRIADGQLEASFAPLAAFQVVRDDPELLAELEEALR